jgi:hypothetical protein
MAMCDTNGQENREWGNIVDAERGKGAAEREVVTYLERCLQGKPLL